MKVMSAFCEYAPPHIVFAAKKKLPIFVQPLQLHPIQILRLGDVEVDLDTVAPSQGHSFNEMRGNELALCGGCGIEQLSPG